MQKIVIANPSWFLGLPIVLFYGLFIRLTFGASYLQGSIGGLVTLAFIFVVPFVLGLLTMAVLPQRLKSSILQAIFMPWVACGLVGAVLVIFAWELIICVVMALPIYLPISSAGGLLYYVLVRRRSEDTVHLGVAIFLLMPYLVAAVENQIPSPQSVRTVNSQIIINAPAEAVWEQITSVPQIQPAEHHPAAFHLLGMPKPIRAMLPETGVGAVRQSSYDGGLFFVEEVITWQPQQSFSFTIALDSDANPPWPWNQIGGPAFEILDGVYTIEPMNEQQVILHLSSRHRLSTKLNVYGGLWTDFLLGDIQRYILTIIKQRAESL